MSNDYVIDCIVQRKSNWNWGQPAKLLQALKNNSDRVKHVNSVNQIV